MATLGPKIYEFHQDRFDGGFSNDIRSKNSTKYGLTKHFDSFTWPHRLFPHPLTEADEVKQYFITKFLYAPYNYGSKPETFKLFGLGVVSGDAITGKVEVYEYPIDSGIDQTWVNGVKGAAAAGSRDQNVFFYYKGYIYGWTGNAIWRFDTSRTAVFADTWQSATRDVVAQPVHCTIDDIAYFFYDNKVGTWDNSSWTAAALTLPDNLYITAACEYGPYLAIACRTRGTARVRSVVYLWDRDSSLTTVTARIDFGEGHIKHIANLNNRLIAVMDYYTGSAYSMTYPKVLVKQASGDFAVLLNEIDLDANTTPASGEAFPGVNACVVKDNKLYFPLTCHIRGDAHAGIWVVDESGKMTIHFVEEDVGTTGTYQGIFNTGNVWFIAHSYDGSVQRSDDAYAFSTTNHSDLETLRFDCNEPRKMKKLIGVHANFEALPTNGSVTVDYRKDEETSWTTIFTDSTDNDVEHDAVNIESSGANLPTFYEIEFRVRSLGGAVITGWGFKAEVLEDASH